MTATTVTSSSVRTVRETAVPPPRGLVHDAVRIKFGNPVADQVPSPPWSIQHPALYTALWAIAIVAILRAARGAQLQPFDQAVARHAVDHASSGS